MSAPLSPPSLRELVVGPFVGLSVYAAGLRLGIGRSLGFVVLVVLVCAATLATLWGVELGGKVSAMADSSIWFMPRVHVEEGRAWVEADPGRLIETDRIVILFDTVSESPEIPRGYGADRRPRVLVRSQAMLFFTPERPAPLALPWSQVTSAVGPISVDGPELIDALRSFVPRMVASLSALFALAALLWQLLLAGILVVLYRALFGRGLYVPRASELFGIAAIATGPPLVLGGVLLALGRQELAVAGHGVLFGALFLLGATRVRFSVPLRAPDEEGGATVSRPARPVVTEL